MENNNLADQMLGMAHASLADCLLRLARYKQGQGLNGDGGMVVHIFGVMQFLLDRDPSLMRQWNKMITALSSTPASEHNNIDLCLERVIEDGTVREKLLGAIKTLHRPRLLLKSTMHSAKFASNVLNVNSTFQSLSIDGTNANPFKSEKNATTLAAAVIRHPTLAILSIIECDMSRKPIIASLFPILQHIEDVRLDGNNIDSHGATLIADCLATNPRVRCLGLEGNRFDDSDASKFAKALETNSTLINLALAGNKIKYNGIMALMNAVIGDSFNSINDANHHCFIDLLAESRANTFDDPDLNRRVKFFSKITHDIGGLGDAVPLELVPRLFIILQGRGIIDGEDDDGKPVFSPMDAVFRYFRAFNATLFNTDVTVLNVVSTIDETITSNNVERAAHIGK